MRTTTLGSRGSAVRVAALRPHARGDRRRPLQAGPAFSPAHPPSWPLAVGPRPARGICAASSKRLATAGTRLRLLPPSLSASQQPSRDGSERDFGSSAAASRRWCVGRRRRAVSAAAERGAHADPRAGGGDGRRPRPEDLELAGLVAPSGASEISPRGAQVLGVRDRHGRQPRRRARPSRGRALFSHRRRRALVVPDVVPRAAVVRRWRGLQSRGAMSLASFSGWLDLGARGSCRRELPEETDELQALWDGDEEARRTGVDPSIREDDRATSFGLTAITRPSSVALHSFRVSFVGGAGGADAHVLGADDGRSVVRLR